MTIEQSEELRDLLKRASEAEENYEKAAEANCKAYKAVKVHKKNIQDFWAKGYSTLNDKESV